MRTATIQVILRQEGRPDEVRPHRGPLAPGQLVRLHRRLWHVAGRDATAAGECPRYVCRPATSRADDRSSAAEFLPGVPFS
jgi:hypothetical protein